MKLDISLQCNPKENKKGSAPTANGSKLLDATCTKINHAHVQSHVQYGRAIQKQLSRSTAIVNKGKHSLPKSKTDFLGLSDLIKLENYKLGYKLINKLLPEKLSVDISLDKNNKSLNKQHKYNTRNKKQLNIPKHESSSYHNSFLCASIRDYSTLPHSMMSCTSLHTFMAQCK